MKLGIILAVLVSACIPKNEINLRVRFMDRADSVPYADEFQVCVPKTDSTMRCVDFSHFMREMGRIELPK